MKTIFEESKLGNIAIKNRLAVAPMCTCMVENGDGIANDFHLAHYTSYAIGQVGFITQEATAVSPEGVITTSDLGIYNNEQEIGLSLIVDSVHRYNGVIGIQLNHAGAKARIEQTTYAPSAVAFDNMKMPQAMSIEDIDRVINDFKAAAERCARIGYDFIEIHGAHGYLINQFISPITNLRKDQYGEDRMLFLMNIIRAVKSVFKKEILVRLSVKDYHDLGLDVEDYIPIVKQLEAEGIAMISISTGGVVANVDYETYPCYQVPYAIELKKHINIPIGVAGLINTIDDVNHTLTNNIDYVLIGRKALRNPYFALEFANENKCISQVDLPLYLKRGYYIK